MSELRYKNPVQEAIFIGSREEGGIWEVIDDINQYHNKGRRYSFELLKEEIDYILNQKDIFLIRSASLILDDSAENIDKESLMRLTISDVDFNEEGPFYYLLSVPV